MKRGQKEKKERERNITELETNASRPCVELSSSCQDSILKQQGLAEDRLRELGEEADASVVCADLRFVRCG